MNNESFWFWVSDHQDATACCCLRPCPNHAGVSVQSRLMSSAMKCFLMITCCVCACVCFIWENQNRSDHRRLRGEGLSPLGAQSLVSQEPAVHAQLGLLSECIFSDVHIYFLVMIVLIFSWQTVSNDWHEWVPGDVRSEIRWQLSALPF